MFTYENPLPVQRKSLKWLYFQQFHRHLGTGYSSKQGQKHHKSMSSKIFQKISKYFADFQFVATRSLSPQSPTLTAFNFPLIVSFPQPDFATDFQNSIELHWLRLKTPLSRYYPEIPHQTGHVSSPSAILFTKKSRNFLDPKKHWNFRYFPFLLAKTSETPRMGIYLKVCDVWGYSANWPMSGGLSNIEPCADRNSGLQCWAEYFRQTDKKGVSVERVKLFGLGPFLSNYTW